MDQEMLSQQLESFPYTDLQCPGVRGYQINKNTASSLSRLCQALVLVEFHTRKTKSLYSQQNWTTIAK